MKIKLYSHYHHFQNHAPEDGEPYIDCYNDIFCMKREIQRQDDIALLIEPRFIQPQVYTYVEQNYNTFRYVFTHDSYLLKNIPNAKSIIWGGVWGTYDGSKTKKISMVTSEKDNNYWRQQRIELAWRLKKVDGIDVYGTFDGGERVKTHEIYANYKFNIAMENCIDDIWMTEKLCNCFSHKTVPIYIGASKVKNYFDTDGMLIVNNIAEAEATAKYLLEHDVADKLYDLMQPAIEHNYEIVKQYAVFEDWFYSKYGNLIGGLHGHHDS